jgi:plasmid stability protein
MNVVHAFRRRRWDNRAMPVNVTIRAVPDDVHRALLDKARRKGMSLQQFALERLSAVAREQDSWETLVAISERLHAEGVRFPDRETVVADIRADRDAR